MQLTVNSVELHCTTSNPKIKKLFTKTYGIGCDASKPIWLGKKSIGCDTSNPKKKNYLQKCMELLHTFLPFMFSLVS